MNVVQVAPRYPPRTGGVETHVAEVSERLVDRGHDVTVVTADRGGNVSPRGTRAGVRVRRRYGLAPGGNYHLAPGVVLAVRRASAGADVVHAHNYHSLIVPLAAVGARAPLVVTPHYHGRSADGFRDRLLSVYAPVGGRVLRTAAACLAVSDWERARLREEFGVTPRTVRNGVNVARFADAEPVVRDRPYLLSVGRLERYKGVQHAVRALTELPAYELVVCGDGNYRETLATVAERAGVTDRVAFLGYVPDAELPGLYAGAAGYLTLSTLEAFGMTVGEALAAGTPCVVSTARALADWVEYPGVVGVEDPEPTAVAAAVEEAVELTPEPATLPDWASATDQVEAVYESL